MSSESSWCCGPRALMCAYYTYPSTRGTKAMGWNNTKEHPVFATIVSSIFFSQTIVEIYVYFEAVGYIIKINLFKMSVKRFFVTFGAIFIKKTAVYIRWSLKPPLEINYLITICYVDICWVCTCSQKWAGLMCSTYHFCLMEKWKHIDY